LILLLARQASKIIRDVSKSGIEVTQKGIGGVDDPMTQADLASQKLIISGLWSVYPSLNIVGEEETPDLQPASTPPQLDLIDQSKVLPELQQVAVEDVCVYIDPLDATKEYTLGRTWCVMTLIGITVKGVPVAGVMHQPFEGEEGFFSFRFVSF
jgi:3'-phosphoadenosine 5'-phosphosulfate (PAPS) 3'-phosphatase